MPIQQMTSPTRTRPQMTPEIRGRLGALGDRMRTFDPRVTGTTPPTSDPGFIRPNPRPGIDPGFNRPAPPNLDPGFIRPTPPRIPNLPMDRIMERRRTRPQITPEIRQRLRMMIEKLKAQRLNFGAVSPESRTDPGFIRPRRDYNLPEPSFTEPRRDYRIPEPGFTRATAPTGFATPLAPADRRARILQLLQRFQGGL